MLTLLTVYHRILIMNKIFNTVKLYWDKFVGIFPSRLPLGMTEFNDWSESIINTYKLPTSNKNDIRWVLASTIIGFGAKTTHKPKFYFVLVIRAAAAKQIAGGVFTEIKEKQRAAQLEAAKKQQEATSQQSASSELPKQGI